MRKITIVLVFLVILAFSVSNHNFLLPKRAFATEILGDLVITGEEKRFENEVVNVNGSIIIQAGGTLSLKNTTLNIVQTRFMQHNITFIGSNLNALDSTLTSRYPFFIYFEADSSMTASSFDAGPSRFSFKDRTKAKLTDTEVMFIRAYDSTVITIEASVLRPSATQLDKEITTLEAHGFSAISLSRTALREATFYNNSRGRFSDTTISTVEKPIRLYDSSKLIVENSGDEWQMETYGYSSALIRKGTLENIKTHDFSLTFISDTIITKGLVSYDSANVFLFDSKIETPASLEQYLAAYDSSRVSIFATRIKGLLSTHDSSFVTADASNIDGLRARESSTLQLYDSTFSTMYLHHSSHVSISDANITLLHIYDSSQVSITDSMATELHLRDSSTASIQDSQINHVYAYAKNIEGSFHGDKPKIYNNRWNSFTDASIAVYSGGYAPNITLERTEILDGLNLAFSGSSNVNITDSTITHLEVSDTTTAHLLNTTVSSHDIAGKAKIYVYWHLEVQAADDASVMVSYYNGTTQETKNVDGSGLATFIMLEKVMESAGTYSIEDYLVDVISSDYPQSQWVTMTENMELALTPPAPWWQQYWYVFLVSAIVIIIAIASLKLRTRKPLRTHNN